MAKLGECFSVIRNGASIRQTDGAGGFPITRIETIADKTINRGKFGYAGIYDLAQYRDYILQDGDILMSHINSEKHLGKVALYSKQDDEQIIHGMNLLMLRADTQKMIPEYAKYYFESQKFLRQIGRITKKSVNQASFTVTALKELEIPLASIIVQRDISEKLKKVDWLVSLRKQQLAKLDELVKARFVEMFGDPADNVNNLSASPMTAICQIIDGDRGKNYPKQEEFSDSGFCLFLNAKNVTAQGFSFENCTYITEEKDALLRNGKLCRGDVVLTTRGTIGNLAFYDTSVPYENIRINSGMVILRMNKQVVSEIFFIEQFKMQLDSIKSRIASGSAQPQLPISTMNKIEMILPPIELQNQFAAFVERVDKQKQTVQQSLEKLEVMKKARMQEYFG